MANTPVTVIGSVKTRYARIDTDATVLSLGHANPKTTGQVTIHLRSNSATGNGVTIQKKMSGTSSSALTCDYQKDSTDTAAGTKVTASSILYVRCDHSETVELSFEIASGSWDVEWSAGAG